MDLTTALEELERITRKWGMVVNYPKTEAVVFGLPAATATAAAAKIQVGSSMHACSDTLDVKLAQLDRVWYIDAGSSL